MRAVSATGSMVRHAGVALVEAILIAAITGAVALGAALFTGHPGGAQGVRAASSAVSVSVPNGTFAGSTVATVDPPASSTWVDAKCYQAGLLVYEQWAQTDASNQAMLTLGPTPSWTSGGASCTASANVLQRGGKMKVVARTTFSVAP